MSRTNIQISSDGCEQQLIQGSCVSCLFVILGLLFTWIKLPNNCNRIDTTLTQYVAVSDMCSNCVYAAFVKHVITKMSSLCRNFSIKMIEVNFWNSNTSNPLVVSKYYCLVSLKIFLCNKNWDNPEKIVVNSATTIIFIYSVFKKWLCFCLEKNATNMWIAFTTSSYASLSIEAEHSRNRLSWTVPMQLLTYNLFHVSFDVMHSIQ